MAHVALGLRLSHQGFAARSWRELRRGEAGEAPTVVS
jgi:hypothetical protein